MGWLSDHYNLDDDGNFEDQDEFDRAFNNGDIKTGDGTNRYDPDTGQDYWPDGTKRG